MKYVVRYPPPADTGRARELFPAHRTWFESFHQRGLPLMIGTFEDAGTDGAGPAPAGPLRLAAAAGGAD
jgi:hypothetical protein